MGEERGEGEDDPNEANLDVDITVGPTLETPPTVEVSQDVAGVGGGFDLGTPSGPSRADETFKIRTGADLEIPGRGSKSFFIAVGFIALFAAAVTAGVVFALTIRDAPTEPAGIPSEEDGVVDGEDAAASAPPDTAQSSDDPAEEPRDEAAADAGRDAGFVIGEIDVPPEVERMRPRARARRARRQRVIALRLHGRMRYERAEAIWRRALVLSPNNPWTHRGLARTLRALGREDEADAWDRRAEEASPMRRRRRRGRRRRRRR